MVLLGYNGLLSECEYTTILSFPYPIAFKPLPASLTEKWIMELEMNMNCVRSVKLLIYFKVWTNETVMSRKYKELSDEF